MQWPLPPCPHPEPLPRAQGWEASSWSPLLFYRWENRGGRDLPQATQQAGFLGHTETPRGSFHPQAQSPRPSFSLQVSSRPWHSRPTTSNGSMSVKGTISLSRDPPQLCSEALDLHRGAETSLVIGERSVKLGLPDRDCWRERLPPGIAGRPGGWRTGSQHFPPPWFSRDLVSMPSPRLRPRKPERYRS